MKSGKRLTFNPSKYSKSSISENSSVRIKSNEIIVTKGDTQQVLDTVKLKNACQKLRKYWRVKLKELKDEGKQAYETLVLHINALHNTEAYPIVYDIVSKECKDLIRDDNIEAGTVSGYIGGCNIEKHFKEQIGCGVFCAGSMPPVGKQAGCKYPIMLATFNGNAYAFHLIQDSEDRKNTIIYYNSAQYTVSNIPGFSHEEKTELRNFRVENINIILYSKNEYKEVHGGFIPLDKLPTRGVEVQPTNLIASNSLDASDEEENKGYESTILIILLLILILLGFFVIYRYYSQR